MQSKYTGTLRYLSQAGRWLRPTCVRPRGPGAVGASRCVACHVPPLASAGMAGRDDNQNSKGNHTNHIVFITIMLHSSQSFWKVPPDTAFGGKRLAARWPDAKTQPDQARPNGIGKEVAALGGVGTTWPMPDAVMCGYPVEFQNRPPAPPCASSCRSPSEPQTPCPDPKWGELVSWPSQALRPVNPDRRW